MAVFLVIAGFGASSLFFPKTGLIEERGVLGGPSPVAAVSMAAGSDNAFTAVQESGAPVVSPDGGEGSYAATPIPGVMENDGALKDLGEPIGPSLSADGTLAYKVQKGDTLSGIASYFGVSVGTIVAMNPGLKANLVKAGMSLRISKTSGIGAQKNEGASSAVLASVASSASTLPNFNGNFILPANGYNWGILHHYNAVDIANSCGTPVVAAASGVVVPDENIPDTDGGWNDGYGNFVLIEHPFGNVSTRYAHLEKVLVQIGDYVSQGQEIGLMGESGDATGCHVHFEVIGARNPFAKS